MIYSSIKRKSCKCGCGKMPTTSYNGYNYSCAPQEILDQIAAKRKEAKKKQNARKADSIKLRKIEREQSLEDRELELWFLLKMQTSEKRCENCGKDLSGLNEFEWRGSQHHIVEKSKINGCPSVASNIYNHMVLGFYCCHSQWHTSQENASKMPCFTEAKRRFNLFKDSIAINEMRKVNPYLYI